MNMMNLHDSIVAISSGSGGAISVLRLSGKESLGILSKVWSSKKDPARHPRELIFGKISCFPSQDTAMAVFMSAPNSYTGEDIVEIHCHGGIISSMLMKKIVEAGARPAEPGEFTYRAFLNGKMDLTQAEAVCDLIGAQSEASAMLAARQLGASLGNRVRQIREPLVSLLAETEARLDFSEEDLLFPDIDIPKSLITNQICEIRRLISSAELGSIMRDGLLIVIAGMPNSGKSSVFNRLLGYERAIVTDIPGTTRDTVEEKILIGDIPAKLVDTAGIREADCIIENLGIERTMLSLSRANMILWVLDASEESRGQIDAMRDHLKGNIKAIAVWNKCDLLEDSKAVPEICIPSVRVSAKNGEGFQELIKSIDETAMSGIHSCDDEIAISMRHLCHFKSAAGALEKALDDFSSEAYETAASEIRNAVMELGKILGEHSQPDILGEIFGRFCIGK